MSDLYKNILNALVKDSRISTDELAALLKVDASEIKIAIQNMEKDGVILGYSCVVNDMFADNQSIRALIEVRINPEEDNGFDHIGSIICEYPKVIDHYLISGSYDFLLVVVGSNLHDISSFVFDHLATMSHVLSTKTHFIMKTYKQNGIVLPQKDSQRMLPVSP